MSNTSRLAISDSNTINSLAITLTWLRPLSILLSRWMIISHSGAASSLFEKLSMSFVSSDNFISDHIKGLHNEP